MNESDLKTVFSWFFPIAVAWVALVIAASVVVRRRRGKPIVPRVPADAVYSERAASARWASNCLIVAVTSEALTVVPRLPFNLMFLPEVYGHERTIPLRDVTEAKRIRSVFDLNVVVRYGDRRELALRVREPKRFLAAIGQGRNG
jgi:hypothetical protein